MLTEADIAVIEVLIEHSGEKSNANLNRILGDIKRMANFEQRLSAVERKVKENSAEIAKLKQAQV